MLSTMGVEKVPGQTALIRKPRGRVFEGCAGGQSDDSMSAASVGGTWMPALLKAMSSRP
jgi:hypothetical protein